MGLSPPQTIISPPVQTAVCWKGAVGALVVLLAVQISLLHAAPSDIYRKRIVSTRRCRSPWDLGMHMEICYQTLREHRLSQTLRDGKGIVPKRCKELTQHLRLLRVLRHAIHFTLQLLSSNWSPQ
jgi:hypothetical protein